MTPKQFEEWLALHRLSLRKAAKLLGLSHLTVLGYQRGFRHDDGRPVTIPEPVALACQALTAQKFGGSVEQVDRSTSAGAEMLLPTWGDLGPATKRRALYALKNRLAFGSVPPKQVFLTKLDRFRPLAAEIVGWLSEHADKGYRLQTVRHPEPAEGHIVVLEIADPDQAFFFKMRWHGYTSGDGDEA